MLCSPSVCLVLSLGSTLKGFRPTWRHVTVRSFLVHSEAVEAGHFFIMSLLSDSDMTTEEDLEHTQDVGKIRYSEQTPDCFFFFLNTIFS